LEHRILQRITELNPRKAGLFKLSGIELDRFYGIEIDDFAHEIALLSLWLAKHQMNVEFKELFGVEISLIPLRDAGSIVSGNALRMDWESVCPVLKDDECYLAGNPPFRGVTYQTAENKEDLAEAFGGRDFSQNLDYVSGWFIKGAEFVARNDVHAGLVSTNSVCQGTHVPMLWPHIYDAGADIEFAHTSFKWTNRARGNAGVTCVVIGLGPSGSSVQRKLYGPSGAAAVSAITPYLTAGDRQTIVYGRSKPLAALPVMNAGNKPADGGGLILSAAERAAIVESSPDAERFIKKFASGGDFLKGSERYCIWVKPDDAETASQIIELNDRFEAVRSFRQASKKAPTRQLADQPWRFAEPRHRPGTSIILPKVSSERREYVPIGFLDDQTVISDKGHVVYDAEPWLFGLIQSRMHMTWMRAVCGRMKSDYSYSNTLVYNTFPVPPLTAADREALHAGALKILAVREASPGKTLAQMYDPDKMPASLKAAHQTLDETVDRIYRPKKEFSSDEERLEMLFELYETMIAEKEAADA